MSHLKIDNALSGVIVFLLLFVVWKWHINQSSCGKSRFRLDCGCMQGECRCRGYSRRSRRRRRPRPSCSTESKQAEKKEQTVEGGGLGQKETMTVENQLAKQIHAHERVTTAGPTPNPADFATDDYESTTIDMALESGVEESHQRYCNSLSFAGLPTGSSSCTTLEETGRSYGTADFVGLTARKFCKARQLATPAPDVRTTPSQSIVEWCDVGMDELI